MIGKNSSSVSINTLWVSRHPMGLGAQSFCSTEPACVNGVGPAAVCNASTKHTLPASPEERSGKITVVVWVKQEVEFDVQL